MAKDRIPTSRIGRSARITGLAAGQAARQLGTQTTNLARGEEATLVLLGDDYDGGHKAWVRWPDGRDDIVPGSRVERR